MTANDDEVTRNEAMDAGCIAYLCKPFAQHVLLNAISKAVAWSAQRNKNARGRYVGWGQEAISWECSFWHEAEIP
jgi:DNA-binding response OmpR family regulator